MLPDRQRSRAGGVTLLREEWAALSRGSVCPCPRLPPGQLRDQQSVGRAREPAQGDGHGELGQRNTKVSREGEIRHYLQDHIKGSVLKHIAGEEEIIKPASCFTFF